MDTEFKIRNIIWSDYDHTTPILLQDENGPCPLIALINTLLLNNEVELRHNQFNDISNTSLQNDIKRLKDYLITKNNIKLEQLLSQLGDLLIKFNQVQPHGEDIDKLLESLPLLHTGLSINPNLIHSNFEVDLSTKLFNIFNLKIRHGWVYKIDGNHHLDNTIIKLGDFDAIQDYLLTNDDNDLKQWLNNTSTQLTDYGLQQLNQQLEIDEFIVFFRNNHFNTLYKKNDNDFYLLLTDASFGEKTSIVWQSLISTSGKDDLFFNGEFLPVLEEIPMDGDAAGEDDLKLIKKLQEEDDAQYAKQLQKSYRNRKPPVKKEIQPDDVKPKGNAREKETKKKSGCIIV